MILSLFLASAVLHSARSVPPLVYDNIGGREVDNCKYFCAPRGGCSVQYVGPPRAGRSSGSCFPHSFGGSCSGTPPECRDCNQVMTCSEGGRKAPRPPRPGRTRNKNCDYSCTRGGGCQVRWVGPHRSGYTKGSCFPQSYSGACSGTPRECQDCNQVLTCSEGERKAPRFRFRTSKNCYKTCIRGAGCSTVCA